MREKYNPSVAYPKNMPPLLQESSRTKFSDLETSKGVASRLTGLAKNVVEFPLKVLVVGAVIGYFGLLEALDSLHIIDLDSGPGPFCVGNHGHNGCC